MNAYEPPLKPTPRQENAGVTELVRELLRQSAEYLRDYGQLVAGEAREKARYLRVLALSLGAAALLLLFGLFFLSVALTAAIAYGLGSWGWAALIVGAAYSVVGLLLILPALRSLRSGALRFNRLQQRVKRDKEWIKTKLAA